MCEFLEKVFFCFPAQKPTTQTRKKERKKLLSSVQLENFSACLSGAREREI